MADIKIALHPGRSIDFKRTNEAGPKLRIIRDRLCENRLVAGRLQGQIAAASTGREATGSLANTAMYGMNIAPFAHKAIDVLFGRRNNLAVRNRLTSEVVRSLLSASRFDADR